MFIFDFKSRFDSEIGPVDCHGHWNAAGRADREPFKALNRRLPSKFKLDGLPGGPAVTVTVGCSRCPGRPVRDRVPVVLTRTRPGGLGPPARLIRLSVGPRLARRRVTNSS